MVNAENLLHQPGAPSTAWSVSNTGEAFPGVLTPLTWTFSHPRIERGFRGTMCDIGVLTNTEVTVPDNPEDCMITIFYGRMATSIEHLRRWADLSPGTTADAVELQILGSVRPGVESHPSRRRYPILAFKMPYALATAKSRVRQQYEEMSRWWRLQTQAPLTDSHAAIALLNEAGERLEQALRIHGVASMLVQALYQQITKLAEKAGRPGFEVALMTGYGNSEEAQIVADLWALSHKRLTLEQFMADHGYHGPAEGELSSKSWREDPGPVLALAKTYGSLDAGADPALLEASRTSTGLQNERELVASLRPHLRPGARAVLALARQLVPMRERGRASYMQAVDVARYAARSLGHNLAEAGVLDNSDDVYYLTLDEVCGTVPDDVKDIVAHRRAQRQEFLDFEIEESWTGVPERKGLPSRGIDSSGGGVVKGIGVSAGVVEGVARVMVDPDATTLAPGEILVCRTTDPSWSALFFLASAVVIDIGGTISHGAIVARELGIPCVINTKEATVLINSGDLLRVDGTTGTVEVLESSVV